MQELISVIVPLYNVEKYLDKCITHIQRQTYSNLEIILVDDGSTDASAQMCDAYAKQDARIKVIHKKNGGTSSARNVGIEAATGSYIGFLDADDYIEETMYEDLYRAARETDCEMVQIMSRDYDEEGNLLKDIYKSSGNTVFIPAKEDFRLLLLYLGDSSFCTKLIKAPLMKEYRFTENRLNEDFELLIRMLQKIKGVYSIEKAGYNILNRQGSNQRGGFKPYLFEAVIDNSDMAYRMMEEMYPDLQEEAKHFLYIQRLDYLLHIPLEQMTRDNRYYRKVIGEVKAGKKDWKKSPYLTKKQKRNLEILSLAPRMAKRVHAVIMKIKTRTKR